MAISTTPNINENTAKQLFSKIKYYYALTLEFIQKEIIEAIPNTFHVNPLQETTLHYFGNGKGLRPVFLMLISELFGGDPEDGLTYAAAIELLHTSSLVHDDWMDRDDIRRGIEAIWKKWNPVTCVLTGDAQLGLAFKLAEGLASDLGKTFTELCISQMMDINFEKRKYIDVTFEESLDMLYLKTGVLFQLACRWGAMIGGSDTKQIKLVEQYADAIGLAFQLQDDILNIIGDPKVMGKPKGSDIIDGKKNPLIIKTLEEAPEDDRQLLLRYLGQPLTDEQMDIARTIVVSYGMPSIESHCNFLVQEAILCLDQLQGVDEDILKLLRQFTYFVINRDK